MLGADDDVLELLPDVDDFDLEDDEWREEE